MLGNQFIDIRSDLLDFVCYSRKSLPYWTLFTACKAKWSTRGHISRCHSCSHPDFVSSLILDGGCVVCYVCVQGGGGGGGGGGGAGAMREIICFQLSMAVRFKYSLCSSVNKPKYCRTTGPILDRGSLNAAHAKGRSRGWRRVTQWKPK